MIVKAICKPNFGDVTTGDTYEQQVKRNYGDIFECDDELAEERIRKGLVKKATKKEEKEYYDNIDTMDGSDVQGNENEFNANGDDGSQDDNENQNDEGQQPLTPNDEETGNKEEKLAE